MTSGIIVLTVFCLVGSVFYKKWATDKALRDLYRLRTTNEEEYIRALDSYYIKFSFSEFNRNLMKLNYWIDKNNEEKINDTLATLSKIKIRDDDKVALYTKLFSFYINNKNYDKAKNIANNLLPILKDKKDDESVLLSGEIEQVVEIFCNKNTDLISTLEETLQNIDNEEVKSVLCYRIARLYRVKGEDELAADYIYNAIQYTNNESTKKDLAMILENLDLLN